MENSVYFNEDKNDPCQDKSYSTENKLMFFTGVKFLRVLSAFFLLKFNIA